MRYRSKPSEIEAVQWIGGSQWSEVQEFGAKIKINRKPGEGVELLLLAGVDGAQGYVTVPVGHWIVRQPGDLTDHWPVDPDYFAGKYEPVRRNHGARCSQPIPHDGPCDADA